jgi:hypothetical protein
VRGLLYATTGVLAVQVALGAGDRQTDQRGALETLATQAPGTALLVVIAVGLGGYALWGVVRAVLDPLNKGADGKGLAQRAGFLVSGVTYGALGIAAMRLLSGRGGGSQGGTDAAQAGWLLAQPFGAWLVGLAGLWMVAAGVGELYLAYSTDFKNDLRREVMGPNELAVATWVGRTGMAARGVVFGLVGMLLIQAALRADATRAGGLDRALTTLAQSPFGSLLLSTVAAGLIAFGVYSALCARWMRISATRVG